MDLSFYPLTLEAIDQAAAEALCLFVGEDERPLTGLSGLADWRLAGGLSRLLRKGLVTGTRGEALLTPGSRLGFRKLFLFGLGPIGWPGTAGSESYEEQLSARVADCVRRLHAAGVEDAAMQLPSRLPLDLGIRTLIDEPLSPARALVFGPDPAALVRALSHAATRGQSDARHERRVIKVPGPPRPQPQARVPQQPKPPTLEMPKPSPLPFQPSVSRSTTANASAPVVVMPTPAGSDFVADAAVAAPTPSSVAPAISEPPLAPAVPDSEPPVASKADPVVAAPEEAAPEAAPKVAPAAAASKGPPPPQAPVEVPRSDAARALESKAPVPLDHKAPRFKPPQPAKKGGGKKKG